MKDNVMKAKIDHYAVLDYEVKDVKRQMDELRSDIIDYAEEAKNAEDKSILIEGDNKKLMVSFAESFSVDTKSKEFESIEQAFDDGDVSEIINKTITMNIPSSKVEAIMATLKEEGLDEFVTVTTKWGIIKKEFEKYRKTKFADIENEELKCKVKEVVKISITAKIQVK